MLGNIIVYIVGFPGTGKLAVAQALAGPLNAKVVDNHWVNNPIFGLLDNDRVTPYPEAVWEQIDMVRRAILETIATLSRPDASFILTHAGYDDGPDDRKLYLEIAAAAARRHAVFVPVRLICEEDELVKRIASPERAARLKSMNVAAAIRDVRTRAVLKPHHPNTLTLDNSRSSPADSAAMILAHVRACRARHARES
jgi:hypothetical protein